MRFGSTLALIGVAAALGGYVYFVDLPAEQARKEAESTAKKLIAFERDDVVGVELPVDEGGRARLVRDKGEAENGGWKLVQPLAVPAEEPSVTGLLTGFERLESEFQLEDPPADLGPFGFRDEDRVVIELDEGEPIQITLGADTPVDAQRYVRLEGRRKGIFGVKKAQTAGLSTSLYRLRDKRISKLDPKDVQSVVVEAQGKLVAQAERLAEGQRAESKDAAAKPAVSGSDAAATDEDRPREWSLRGPIEDRGDFDRIQRLVQDLHFARASAFVDQPGDGKSYGLDKPAVQVELVAAEGRRERLRMGRVGEKIYVQVDDRTPVYEVDERTLSSVPTDTFAYRFKRVLTIPERAPRRVELLFPRDGAKHAFVRSGEDQPWKPEEPELKIADPGVVDDLLFELYNLDATALVESTDRAKLGLEPPQLRVTVRGENDAELGWVELGDVGNEEGIAASSSQTHRVWRVKPDIASAAPIGVEEFRTRWQEGKKPEQPAADMQLGPHGIPLPLPPKGGQAQPPDPH